MNKHIITHSVNKKTKLILLEIDIRFINDINKCINERLYNLETNRPHEEREEIKRLKEYRDLLLEKASKVNE